MVFMRHRCAKDSHDAVAQNLVYRAFEAMYGIHHDVDSRVQELLGRFRVEVLDELRRVFDVGKADGDLLAFTFEGTAGGENLLRQVCWGVRNRRRLLVGCWC